MSEFHPKLPLLLFAARFKFAERDRTFEIHSTGSNFGHLKHIKSCIIGRKII